MQKIILILVLIISLAWTQVYNENAPFSDFADVPIGFASLDSGTTGGTGGDMIIVTEAQQLADIMKPREKNVTDPLVIFISGTLSGLSDMLDIKRTANISVLGLENDAGFLGFGIKIVDSNNIIIRNLTFADCSVEEKDGLTIDGSFNIWVDHCTFTDSPAIDPDGDNHDGLLDIKRGSHNVTVSYNYLTNHRKTSLFGHSVKETGDVIMEATYYCNWFDGTYSRHPRTRYGKVHLLNNLYTNIQGYGVGVTCAAQVMLEGNYFENTAIPVLISQINDPGGTLSGDPEGFLKASANYVDNSGAIVENLSGYDFDPRNFYDYTVVDSQEVKSIVQAAAGAGKINITGLSIKEKTKLPLVFELHQNYPNPLNSSTRIQYSVKKRDQIVLEIININGQKIKTLFDGYRNEGDYTVYWHGTNLQNLQVPTGIYICRLSNSNKTQSRKMLLIK